MVPTKRQSANSFNKQKKRRRSAPKNITRGESSQAGVSGEAGTEIDGNIDGDGKVYKAKAWSIFTKKPVGSDLELTCTICGYVEGKI